MSHLSSKDVATKGVPTLGTMSQSQKVSVSLPDDLLAYTERYQQAHGLSSRSEVVVRALKTLREAELAEGYRALAAEYEERPDLLTDTIGTEGQGLEPSDETSW